MDFYLPELKLAFEYQGIQHYADVFAVGASQAQKEVDLSKSAVCASLGITLIEVPFDASIMESELTRLVVQARPDLSASVNAKQVGP